MIREGGRTITNSDNVLRLTQFSTITEPLLLTFRAAAILGMAFGNKPAAAVALPDAGYSLALGTNVLAKGALRLKSPTAGAVGGLTPNDIIWTGTMPPGNLSLTFTGLVADAVELQQDVDEEGSPDASGVGVIAFFDVTAE